VLVASFQVKIVVFVPLQEVDKQEKALFPGLSFKRAKGLEPSTLSLGKTSRSAPEGKVLLYFC
jgi:hypothetical protein